MPAVFTASLAKSLDTKCALRVKEAEDGEPVSVGTIYITPGGRQMKVLSTGAGSHSFKLTNDPPEQNCKPSVDYLFRSVAQGYPKKSCAVIMTGMGSDGTLGARLVKRTGGYVIAQDQATSVVFGMPKSVIEAGVVDKVCPLGEISAEIVSAVRGRRR
jgi:two-component system chemotaxis response regulator CheB